MHPLFLRSMLLLSVLAAAPGGAALRAGEAGEGWVLAKESQGIRIWTRKRPGADYLEARGSMSLEKLRLASVIALFQDTPGYTRWMYETREARVLQVTGFAERYNYTVIKGFGPIDDRDAVTRSVMSQDSGSRALTIRMEGVPDLLPARKNRVRIRRLNGEWSFTPGGAGRVEVSYRIYMEPAGSLPASLSNLVADRVPFETLRKLREVIREPRYAGAASCPEIREAE